MISEAQNKAEEQMCVFAKLAFNGGASREDLHRQLDLAIDEVKLRTASVCGMTRIVIENARKDPNYNPYCIPCPGLIRMVKLSPLHWKCKICNAESDLREHLTPDHK